MYIIQVSGSMKPSWCAEIHKLVIKYNLTELWNNENKINEPQTQALNLKQGW